MMENNIRFSPHTNAYLLKFEVAKMNLAKLSKERQEISSLQLADVHSALNMKKIKR